MYSNGTSGKLPVSQSLLFCPVKCEQSFALNSFTREVYLPQQIKLYFSSGILCHMEVADTVFDREINNYSSVKICWLESTPRLCSPGNYANLQIAE